MEETSRYIMDCTISAVTSSWGISSKEVVAYWRYYGRVQKCKNPVRIRDDLAEIRTGYISDKSTTFLFGFQFLNLNVLNNGQ